MDREEKLSTALSHLETQRNLMVGVVCGKSGLTLRAVVRLIAPLAETVRALQGKGKRKKVKDADGDAPAVFQWAKERKK